MRQITRLAVAAAALLAASGVAQAQDKVRIGTEGAFPPFNYYNSDNELEGFDIDIAKALCDEMEVECEFVAQDWDGIIPALLANKYDAIVASMSITEERQKVVDFTDKYYQTPARFVAPKDSDIEDVSPEAMADMTIGAQSSTTQASYLEDKYSDADIKLYPTQDEANADLANGRLDAVFADSTVLYEWLNSTDQGGCCKFVGEPLTDEAYFGPVGIAVRKGDEELKQKLNDAIAAIRENGTYETINEKYFPFSIY